MTSSIHPSKWKSCNIKQVSELVWYMEILKCFKALRNIYLTCLQCWRNNVCFVSWKSLLQLRSFHAKVLKIPMKWYNQIWIYISSSSGLIHHLLSVILKFSFLWLKNNFHSFVNLNAIKIHKSEKKAFFVLNQPLFCYEERTLNF